MEITEMGQLNDVDDATFLKPIYMATILSPLVLLTNMPLQMMPRKKAPLYQLINVRVFNGQIYLTQYG